MFCWSCFEQQVVLDDLRGLKSLPIWAILWSDFSVQVGRPHETAAWNIQGTAQQRLLLHFCPSCSLKKKFHFAYNKNRYKNGFCPSQQACNTREGSLSYTTSYTHSRSREVRKTLQLKQNCCARWAEASYLCFGISVSLARGFKGLKHLCSYLFNSSNI